MALGLSLAWLHFPAEAAHDDAGNTFEVRAFVDDSCIVADEPFFIPVDSATDADQAKFLPLLGLVIGKLAELFINHEIQVSAERLKSGAARKDTHYAVLRHMNLYRADFDPAPVLGINAKLGCMTIVAATFSPEPAQCTANYAPKALSRDSMKLAQSEWKTSRTDQSIENQLRRANVCVLGKVRAVYESRFEFSNDGTAYRLKDAGYHVESLLTTSDPQASRATLYTLKISNPGATDAQEILSSAWVNIGTVKPGSISTGSGGDAAPWLKVPPLSIEARRSYEEKTKVHQDVMGEIEALRRATTRNQRLLAGLDQRIVNAGPELVEGLKAERVRVAVQGQEQSAELDARMAEYRDLPRAPLEFMPVTIEVAVTETESEKKARLALAEIIGKNSDTVASAVGTAASGLLSKSVDSADIKLDADPPQTGELAKARDDYYDALVAAHAGAGAGAGAANDASQRELATAKLRYNDIRRSLGMEPLK